MKKIVYILLLERRYCYTVADEIKIVGVFSSYELAKRAKEAVALFRGKPPGEKEGFEEVLSIKRIKIDELKLNKEEK